MPRKKLTTSIAVLFIALICVSWMAGCASQSTPATPQVASGNIVGTWSVAMGSASGPTWQFLDGGKLTETLAKMSGGTQSLQGTYVLNGNSMTVTTVGKGGATIVGTVTWVSADSFQYAVGGGTLTFTRKK